MFTQVQGDKEATNRHSLARHLRVKNLTSMPNFDRRLKTSNYASKMLSNIKTIPDYKYKVALLVGSADGLRKGPLTIAKLQYALPKQTRLLDGANDILPG